jgi:hypothetical protein
MKNLHLLPTDKPSRLCYDKDDNLLFAPNAGWSIADGKQHIYITSDSEIKEGDYYLCKLSMTLKKCIGDEYFNNVDEKKIILTTDQDLIKDGVQAIDDQFLEWFVKNPSCEFVEVQKWASLAECGYSYHITIPQEDPKQETLEEAAERFYPISKGGSMWMPSAHNCNQANKQEGFIEGAKWQAERMYSEEEVINLLETQRGNSYVAVLTATKNDELASIALNAPEPGAMKQFKKK